MDAAAAASAAASADASRPLLRLPKPLCERYAVDNSHRTLHGALLDAEILAEVYMAMTRGQESLIMELGNDASSQAESAEQAHTGGQRRPQHILRASADELAEHEILLAEIQKESWGKCLWLAGESAT